MAERRDRLKTIYDMLNSIQEKGGKIKPTHLLYKSNLSHGKMQLYLSELLENGMVKEEFHDANKIYCITDKGIKFLNEYRRIKEFTASFGL
jgi:predicted transcriptional regulator